MYDIFSTMVGNQRNVTMGTYEKSIGGIWYI